MSRRVIGYDKQGKKIWSDPEPTPDPEPADIDGLLKFDLSPSWKEQNDRRWETVKKANAA